MSIDYSILPWEGLKQVYKAEERKLDSAAVETFVRSLTSVFDSEICKIIEGQILRGDITTEINCITGEYRGTLVNRIQAYIWKNYGIQLGPKCNVLNNAYTLATKSLLPPSLYGRWDETFNWTPGDFGDHRSCFWMGHAPTRYFMKELQEAVAFQLFQKVEDPGSSIKEKAYHKSPMCQGRDWFTGFGRCWVLRHIPVEGVYIVFNAYPGNQLLKSFAECILNGLKEENQELDLIIKTVPIDNAGETSGWFYLNGGSAIAIGAAERLETLSKVSLNYKPPQEQNKLKDYLGYCSSGCGKYVWRDRPVIYEKRGRKILCFCEQCMMSLKAQFFRTCFMCNSPTLWIPSGEYRNFDIHARMVKIKDKNEQKTIGYQAIMCPKCVSECDEDHYEILGKKPKEVLVISNGIASFIQENEYNDDLEEYITFDEEAARNDDLDDDFDDEFEEDEQDEEDEEDEQDEDYEEDDYEENEAGEYEEEIA